jgi:hypothetical protein
LSQPECVLSADDADLLAVGADEPDLADTDPVVDAGLDADAVLLVGVGLLDRRPTGFQ